MSHVGRLLVATPLIGDPTFERTVVLLLAHGPQGAFGVVLNRPSDTRVEDVAPDWEFLAPAPGVVFVGGPVSRDSLVALGRASDLPAGAPDTVVGDCAAVDLSRPNDEAGPDWRAVRLFAGSAGWAPRQLDDELREGAWWVVDALADDIVTDRPDDLWTTVLRRQRGEVAWFANHPEDPTAN